MRMTLAVCLLSLLAACKTVPGTGRRQLNWISLGQEMALGVQAYEEMASANVITSGRDYQMVQRIGERIAGAAQRMYPDPAAGFEWEIRLLDEPDTANAWCLPGGKMAVYTGLLPITQDEDGLAAVVGHEVAHAVARHGGERMTQTSLLQAALQGTSSVVLRDMEPAKKDSIMQKLAGVGQFGVLLPFSRHHESEADQLGLYMAADAGYDPQAAVGLWERMAAASSGERPPEFMSTHPSEETRISRLKEWMPEALEIYRKSSQRPQP